MIEIASNYTITFKSENMRTKLFLEKDSSKQRLMDIMLRHLREHNVKTDIEAGVMTSGDLSFSEIDNYYWMVSNTDKRCRGLFYDFHDAVDFYVFLLLKSYPHAVDWDFLLKKQSFIDYVKAATPAKHYRLNTDPQANWVKIESDYPEGFFAPELDVYEKLGYIEGQKFIYEGMLRALGPRAADISEPLGTLGVDWSDTTMCEANGYWFITNGERGTVYFGSLFFSYRDAVDFYFYRAFPDMIAKQEIPWPEVSNDPLKNNP